jgi:hypothetical protein
MAKTMRVTWSGVQLWDAYNYVGATVSADRYLDRCLNAAHDELGGLLKVERPLEGGFKAQLPKQRAEYELSYDAVFGLKEAYTQALMGSRDRTPATFEARRSILGAAAAIGKKFTDALRKQANLDAQPESVPEFDLDDAAGDPLNEPKKE